MQLFGKLKPGMSTKVISDNNPTAELEAIVDVVDPMGDAGSGTFGARLVLANPEGAIAAGWGADSADDTELLPFTTVTEVPSEKPKELLFLDSGVSDGEQLVADLLASHDADVQIFLINTERDGVEQITEVLAESSGIDAIHILSHGSQGEVNLGTCIAR